MKHTSLIFALLLLGAACADDTSDTPMDNSTADMRADEDQSPGMDAGMDVGASGDLGAKSDMETDMGRGEDAGGDANGDVDMGVDMHSAQDMAEDMTPTIPNDLCAGATSLEAGVRVTGSTEGSRFGPEPARSSLWRDAGKARWFRYTFTDDATANLQTVGVDYNIWLGAMGSCPTSSSVSGTFKSSRDGMLSWDGSTGDTVHIVVTGEDGEEGLFELEVTLEP